MADRGTLRRLGTLSDTVFGVAVTFMAYRLPVPDRAGPAPSWTGIEDAYGPRLLTLVLSFSVAVLFWLSHHRRLAIVRRPGSAASPLNFAFLLLVILLPVTSDLFGTYGRGGVVVELYAGHLALTASVNLILWVMVAFSDGVRPSWRLIAGPGVVTTAFTAAAVLARWEDGVAECLMFSAFLGPLVSYAVRAPDQVPS